MNDSWICSYCKKEYCDSSPCRCVDDAKANDDDRRYHVWKEDN